MFRTIAALAALALAWPSTPAAACTPPGASFASGSIRLNGESLAEIDRIVASWRRAPSQRIVLAAISDRAGSAASNMRLSRRRGEEVKAALMRRGIPASVIDLQVLGETSHTANGVAHAFYRRVWIELVATPGCLG
jgi:outer membrane protein OmpA-like peptidoglycan-associated protein